MAGLHELEVSENLDASQRVVQLDPAGEVDRDALIELGQTPGLTGIAIGPSEVLAGDPHLVDTFDLAGHPITLRRHVLAFFQGNRYLLRDLVGHVTDQIASGDTVVDLYAGTGLFSVAAAVVHGARVISVEGDRVAAADLKANAAALNGALEAVHQPVEEFVASRRIKSGSVPAVLIVDPPRTGMSKEALEGALRMRPRTIVYVSCDVATLARDARALLDGGYSLKHLTAFDLFPNTPHVETVGTFTS
jgi:23S rRNA (uracil1939-C5)-methyltransferase